MKLSELIKISNNASTDGAIQDYIAKFGINDFLRLMSFWDDTKLSDEDIVNDLQSLTFDN